MSFVLSCSLLSGSQPVIFEWLKNGQKFPKETNAKIDVSPMFSLLTFQHLQKDDSANFTCHARNMFGSHSTSTNLIVKGFMINILQLTVLLLLTFCLFA